MEKMIRKLKEAADLKVNIAKQEVLLWQTVSEAFDGYLTQERPTSRPQASTPRKSEPPVTFMNADQAAEYLGIASSTLSVWRCHGKGPQYVKMGSTVRYKIQDLDDYIANNVYPHTSAYKRASKG